jgi:plastocyanin domain-containing protein
MAEIIKKHGAKFVAGFIAGAVLFAMMAFSIGSSQNAAPAREIVLIAKDVAFRNAGEAEPANPTIVLKQGETVRLTLINREPGQVLHCFSIAGLGVKTSRILATGESETLSFSPAEKGVFSYACLMHPMMAGKILVE